MQQLLSGFTTLKVRANSPWSIPDGYMGHRRVGTITRPFADKAVRMFQYDIRRFSNMSEYDPESLYGRLASYDGVGVYNPDKSKLRDAFRIVRNRWAEIKVDPLPLDHMLITEIKGNKNSGLPSFTRKLEDFPRALEEARNIASGVTSPPPCIAFSRTQGTEGKDAKPKTRLVWGFPFSVTLLEATIFRPILEAIKLSDTRYVMGKRKLQVATMLDHLKFYPVRTTFDWSQFDASVSTQLIGMAFTIVKDSLSHVPEYAKFVESYFCTCPILMPDGKLIVGRRKGIPSGSYGTSVIGCIVNDILLTYLYSFLDVHHETYILGDDSISGVSGRVNTELMRKLAFEHFGMKLTVEPADYAGDVKFLGHAWTKGRPRRPLEVSFQRLHYSERFSDVGFYELLLSLYADNANLWDSLDPEIKGRLRYVQHRDPWDTDWAKEFDGQRGLSSVYTATL